MPADSPRPQKDRLFVGQLIEFGPSKHEFHPNGHPSFYVKLKNDGHVQTIWGPDLKRAFADSKSQPKLNDLIGIRENNLDPVEVITRERKDGVVIASRQFDSPRPHWVVEKLEEFDRRRFGAEALRDPSIPRRDAIISHRELAGFYWVLDAATKVAEAKIRDPERQKLFLKLTRESLALAFERAEPAPIPPKGGAEPASRAAESPARAQSMPPAARTRE